tara:strand:+ start:3193 stop:3600 length:408 start_codon:yes stop_codon:yes gene_type:complete
MTLPTDMISQARAALVHAYCPYSNYAVAACIRAEDGTLFTATNVENAAYNLCSCAETNAITHLVSTGRRKITACVVVVSDQQPATPCGACRQRLNEFASPDLPVFCLGSGDAIQQYTLAQLLPAAFGPENLENPA